MENHFEIKNGQPRITGRVKEGFYEDVPQQYINVMREYDKTRNIKDITPRASRDKDELHRPLDKRGKAPLTSKRPELA